MENLIVMDSEFLGTTKAKVKQVIVDSEDNQVLVCDLYKVNEENEDELVYQDKAWILGTQPFEYVVEDV